MTQDLERLCSIKSFPSLVKYLRDKLDWDFETEDEEDLTYEYSAAEFGLDIKSAAAIRDIKQLRPLVDKQPWGIFYLDFAGQKLSIGALRGILRGLVAKKRASANQSEMRKWQVENLLFICTSDGFENFNFAYFRGSETNRAVLSTFGWRHGDTHLRTLAEYNLPALSFPSDTSNTEEWLKKWRAAFDVEKVTDEFFRRYNQVFTEVEKEVTKTVPDERRVRLFTQKLFNRLMFIYFIQRKGWLSFKDHPRNKYLRALFDEAVANKENFFSDRLYWLFFRGMSVADMKLAKHTEDELRERRGDVPPLNGGLFELEDELDPRGSVPIPNSCFVAILDLFERYNFTIEESTPLDVQVAVDPEMLGKVFEELVTGRHETGSYYTPRQIVSFMCREALKHYLAAVQPSIQAVAKFVDEEDASDLANPEAVLEALKLVRVCDPACGSGAYLLGMLHELMRLRAALFKSKKIDDATLYERKRWIIENNLYGVDNDAFAVQIACLRLWLSLAIDSDQPRPLPNLDYKIEMGDSLIAPAPSESEKQKTFARTALVNDFHQAKGEYMREDDPIHKLQQRQRIENLKGEIALALKHRVPRLTEGQLQKKREESSLLEKSIESARNLGIKTELQKQAEKLRQTLAAHTKATSEVDTGFDWVDEAGTLWLWAWPELLGHSEPITWMFSPVTGKRNWPGDLWGIDEQGTLILVEAKRSKSSSAHDPFADFVSEKGRIPFPDVPAILKHWEALGREEQFFIEQCGETLKQGTREATPKLWRGVIPYSLKRVIVWRWRELYRKKIMPRLRKSGEQKVRQLLDFRQQSKNDRVQYFGMFTVVNSGKPALSPTGKTRLEQLKSVVVETQVHLRAVQLVSISPDDVEISSYEPVV